MVNEANIELIPYLDLDDEEMRDYAYAIHEMVTDGLVHDQLGNLALHGVIKRHSITPDDSFATLTRARKAMQGGMIKAYAVYVPPSADKESNTFIGTATLQPQTGVQLREQLLPISPPLARRVATILPFMSRVVGKLDENAVAWTDSRRTTWKGELVAAQAALIDEANPESNLWRIIPRSQVRNEHTHWGSMMWQAGFMDALADRPHLDDGEVSSIVLPPSVLYATKSIAA